jgi:hypothetical protein
MSTPRLSNVNIFQLREYLNNLPASYDTIKITFGVSAGNDMFYSSIFKIEHMVVKLTDDTEDGMVCISFPLEKVTKVTVRQPDEIQ